MSDKIYCGSAKARDTQYGEQLTVSINLTALLANYGEHGYIAKSDNKMMTLKINRRKEVGKYGETHTCEIDTFKPTRSGNGQSVPENRQDAGKGGSRASGEGLQGGFQSDIPF